MYSPTYSSTHDHVTCTRVYSTTEWLLTRSYRTMYVQKTVGPQPLWLAPIRTAITLHPQPRPELIDGIEYHTSIFALHAKRPL